MRVPYFLPVLFLAATSAFEVGKDYVYHYNGKLQVQNPEQPLQSSGFAFRSKVVAQPRPEYTHFKTANFYRGKLCGLCGDYNYERQHELVGPKLHRYKVRQELRGSRGRVHRTLNTILLNIIIQPFFSRTLQVGISVQK